MCLPPEVPLKLLLKGYTLERLAEEIDTEEN